MATTRTKSDREITTSVVRSLEPIDLDQWLDRYARAIVEAESKRTPQPHQPRLVP